MRICCLVLGVLAAAASRRVDEVPGCDVLIAGGSTASLAAAVTAANSSASVNVCFLEITDWPGGQMTSSAVPAIDFGPKNSDPPSPNLPSFFNELLVDQPGRSNCWVSAKCYQPQILVEWLWPVLSAFPNLAVYLNTTVVAAERDPATGRVTAVTAVQRTPRAGVDPWAIPVSAQIADWYDPADSAVFSKQTLRFTNFSVVVDATEFGDVLATAGVGTAQGVEAPEEDSTTYLDYCGQGTVFPFFLTLAADQQPTPPVPAGSSEGAPFSLSNFTWERVWSYRRTVSAPSSTFDTVTPGETSNQNWGGGNDFDTGYLFNPGSQNSSGIPWTGGLNLTAMQQAEQRAYGWYHAYVNWSSPTLQPHLRLNTTLSGTGTGLSKLPYLRDTRRSAAGIQGFRLFAEALRNCTYPGPLPPQALTAPSRWWHPSVQSAEGAHLNNSFAAQAGAACSTGYHFKDTIGIGQYFYTDVHEEVRGMCPYPSYLVAGDPVLPYYLPFRALTSADAPNLLVAGKTMAQTFWANAGTRLHPEEWVTGTAAGAAAAIMTAQRWDSEKMYDNVATLQKALQAQFGSPLEWTL